MAKVIWSPLVSSARGRLGGMIAQGGPGGAMLRAASNAPRRASAASQTAQADLTTASRMWADLTAAERALWCAIGRTYDPASTGPGRAFALGRRAFIRYALQYIHFGITVPTAPTVYPFVPLDRFLLAWDPDSEGTFFLWYGPAGADVRLRVWLQQCPYYPQFSPRRPWMLGFDSKTDGGPIHIDPDPLVPWSLPSEPFAPFARFGVSSTWRARVSGLDNTGRVFAFDEGRADLVFP